MATYAAVSGAHLKKGLGQNGGTTGSGSSGDPSGGIDTSTCTLLVAVVTSYESSTAPTISDSKSNTWQTDITQQITTGGVRTKLFYCKSPTVGTSHTFTVSGSNSYSAIEVAGFSGADLSSPLDQQSGAADNSGTLTTQAPGSITPSQNDELIIVCVGVNPGSTSLTVGSGCTISDSLDGSGGNYFTTGLAYKIQTTAAAINPAFSWTTAGYDATVVASFKAAAGNPINVNVPAASLTLAAVAPVVTVPAHIYYVDNAGSDSNDGLSLANAWQTCSKVNSTTLYPGDEVRFTAGQTFTGPLLLTNSGTSSAYIRIGTGRNSNANSAAVPNFASGGSWSAPSSPATITAVDTYPGGFKATDAEYWWMDNIIVNGSGVNFVANSPINGQGIGYTASRACAVNIKTTSTSHAQRGIRITAVEGKHCMFGFSAWMATNDKLGFDALQVYRCSFHDCGWWAYQAPFVYDLDNMTGSPGVATTPSTNMYVGYSEFYNIPGTTSGSGSGQAIGVAWFKFTDGICEYSVAHDIQVHPSYGGGAGTGGFAGGGYTGMTHRYCEVYKVHTNIDHYDGSGFECEPSVGNVWEYCYAHDNDGPGFHVPAGTIRYCVSANNIRDANTRTAIFGTLGQIAAEIVHVTSDATDLYIESCTIISTTSGKPAFKCPGTGMGNEYIYNSILVVPSGADVIDCSATSNKLTGAIGNVYYANGGGLSIKNGASTYTSLSSFRTAGFETNGGSNYGVFADPSLSNPGGAPSTGTLPSNPVSSLAYWNPNANSPAINAGISYGTLSITPGSIDFRGNNNFSGGAYDSGAVEFQSAKFYSMIFGAD